MIPFDFREIDRLFVLWATERVYKKNRLYVYRTTGFSSADYNIYSDQRYRDSVSASLSFEKDLSENQEYLYAFTFRGNNIYSGRYLIGTWQTGEIVPYIRKQKNNTIVHGFYNWIRENIFKAKVLNYLLVHYYEEFLYKIEKHITLLLTKYDQIITDIPILVNKGLVEAMPLNCTYCPPYSSKAGGNFTRTKKEYVFLRSLLKTQKELEMRSFPYYLLRHMQGYTLPKLEKESGKVGIITGSNWEFSLWLKEKYEKIYPSIEFTAMCMFF